MKSDAPARFALDPQLDPERLRKEFARAGRVRIGPFLARDGADRLRTHLTDRDDWRLVLNAGEKVYEIDRAGQAAMSDGQREELDRKVLAAAAGGFQYRFESIRVPDDEPGRTSRGSLLDDFALFMSGGQALEMLRTVTGSPDISFADAQATRYGPGHFLTSHDDAIEGKNRRAAYVFGLTQGWRAEWGGLLLFHDASGDIERGMTPRFNSLNIFAVPQLHSVSYVTPSAPEARLSITGWLRSGRPGT